MFQVGYPGQVGDVEMQDLIFTTKGQTPGAVLVQWNIKASAPGPPAFGVRLIRFPDLRLKVH